MVYEQHTLGVDTRGRGTYEITPKIQDIVAATSIQTGLCHLFIQHTSASIMLCENADPDVRVDLETFMQSITPDGAPMFCHTTEGPDDMPAHVRTLLTNVSLTLPVSASRCQLGTWQGIYLWEHRTAPHDRKVIITVQGE